VIARDAKSIGRRQSADVSPAVSGKIGGTHARGFDQSRTANASSAAMLGKLSVVDGVDDGPQHPNRLIHRASARKVLRYLPMPSRARRICASNAGS
jgi:hypothetical protein